MQAETGGKFWRLPLLRQEFSSTRADLAEPRRTSFQLPVPKAK